MNNKDRFSHLHGLIGGLTTDYFEFYCEECGSNIPRVCFYGIDTVGVRLWTKCEKCQREFIFKIKTYPNFGPIQITDEYGNLGFKAYHRGKLKKLLRELGHPAYKKTEE